MKYNIELSNNANKAIRKKTLTEKDLLDALDKFISWTEKKDVNIDVTKMVGVWEGFYRIRLGDLRIILLVDYERHVIFVDRIGPRGDVYK